MMALPSGCQRLKGTCVREATAGPGRIAIAGSESGENGLAMRFRLQAMLQTRHEHRFD